MDKQNNTEVSNFNGSLIKDTVLRQILRKVEKITAAIFIVTSSIEDDELIRKRSRELCIDTLSFMNNVDLDAELSPIIKRQMFPVKMLLDEILSLLSVARMAGLISEMNHVVLVKELNILSSQINDADSGLVQDILESNTIITKYNNNQINHFNSTQIPKGQNNVSYNQKDKNLKTMSYASNKDIKTSRRQKILNFIKDNGVVSIKDLCKIKDKDISGCSEKTIQRELISMIKDGIVKREGDKRWAKYSLN